MTLQTTTKSAEWYARRAQLIPKALGIFNPSTAVTAKGAIITDADGRRLIDFAGGIGVLNAGHCPEPVVQAIQAQAAQLIHSCFNVAVTESYLDLAEKLVELLPHGEATKVMMVNSGAEAVENAVKIARTATGRSGIVCFTGAFHGRTMMAMTLTSKSKYKTGCAPFAGEVYRLDYPYYYRYGNGRSEQAYIADEIQKMRDFFTYQVTPESVAAVIFELVQGEGGFTVMPPAYLKALQEICEQHGILMIADEVQSGFGRTGSWGAFQQYEGFVPDLSTWAKSMGSGMPIGCVMGKAAVMDNAIAGTIGGTYAGNPVCCAAALATIQYMESIDINAKGRAVGEIVRQRFEQWAQQYPQVVGNVRGMGAMLAIELITDGNRFSPNAQLTQQLVKHCHENGLIIISAGIFANCIRILSPLVITPDELNEGLDILERALVDLA